MLKILILLWSYLAFCCFFGCGTASQAKPYTSLTKEQEARKALDESDFVKAIELYQDLVSEEPENYERYPFLATAYARLAGFDVFDTIINGISGASSGASALDQLTNTVPLDPTQEQIAAMLQARSTLLLMPESHRDSSQTSVSYATSAALQLQLYQAAYPLMLMNKFAAKVSDGSLDPERLASMTDEEADAMITSLQSAGAAGGTVGEGLRQVLDQIQNEPGTSNKDKITSYLANRT